MSETPPAGTSVQVAPRQEAEAHGHPGPRQYVVVAVWLFIITGIEISLYYAELAELLPVWALTVSLITLSTIKFFLVAMWYMHLKFDSVLFRRLFVLGIVLAFAVFIVVLLTFGVFVEVLGGVAG